VVTPSLRDLLADLSAQHPDKSSWPIPARALTSFAAWSSSRTARGEEACRKCRSRGLRPTAAPRGTPFLFVTQGEDGVAVVTASDEQFAPARNVGKPVASAGAGGSRAWPRRDRSPLPSGRFGNVASITVTKGTRTATPAPQMSTGLPTLRAGAELLIGCGNYSDAVFTLRHEQKGRFHAAPQLGVIHGSNNLRHASSASWRFA